MTVPLFSTSFNLTNVDFVTQIFPAEPDISLTREGLCESHKTGIYVSRILVYNSFSFLNAELQGENEGT